MLPRPTSLPALHPSALNLLAALWMLALFNGPFWVALWRAVGGWDAPAAFLLGLPLFALAWLWLLIEALTWGRAARPVLALLLVLSAAASHFMSAYGVVVDATMVANVAETDPAEARELLEPRLFASVLGLGVLPAWLLLRLPRRPQRWSRSLLDKGIAVAVAASAMALLLAPSFASYAALLRNHRELRLQLVPSNLLGAVHHHARTRWVTPAPLQQVGLDALRVAGERPRLLLLVVGETARADHFALNGYARDTNPRLGGVADLVSFADASSCGTATAVSLPCMFLDAGREHYEDLLARRRESLLDVLQRAGVSVLWRDNNSGCKGVCDRVPHEDLARAALPGHCNAGECHDEILLHGLHEWLQGQRGDAIVVLHMKGSHGPAYQLRYPARFEHFAPVCSAQQLDRCPREQLVNAYDNSLRYTDHVLAQALQLLGDAGDRFDTAMLYASDHGESLGERGVYLHGLPYAMAPREQTHVPMLLWLSPSWREHAGVDLGCLQRERGAPRSHDHLYHSVLGLFAVRTQLYRSGLDLLAPCRDTALLAGVPATPR